MRRLTSLDFLVEQELCNFLEGWGHPVIPPAGFTTLCVWNITLNSLFCGSSLAKTPDSFPIIHIYIYIYTYTYIYIYIYICPPNVLQIHTSSEKNCVFRAFNWLWDQKPGTLVLKDSRRSSKIVAIFLKSLVPGYPW